MARLDELTLGADPIATDEVPTENIPEQGGSYIPLLPFTTFQFRLPDDLAECWEAFEHTDATTGAKTQRVRLRLDASHPLVVVGGPRDGAVMTATISSVPRPRGREKQPIADLFYLLRTSLADKTPIRTQSDWIRAINAHAGRSIWLDLGGSARCDDTRVRYILTVNPEDPESYLAVEDPDGHHGCGHKYYTRDVKRDPETGQPLERFQCDKCGASLRVFQQIEKFKAPPAGAGR